MVVERAHSPAICDVAGLIDDVDSLWPRGIRIVGGVGHVVDAERYRIFKSIDEIVGDGDALLQRFWLGVADIFLHVGFHLPFVGRMRFANVDGQKIRVVFIVLVDSCDVANLATEGRSSVTAKHDHEWALANTLANVKVRCAVNRKDARVGSVVADFQFAAMHVRKGIAQHGDGVFGASRHEGESDEAKDQQRK